MMSRNDALIENVKRALGERVVDLSAALGEVTLAVRATDHHAVALALRDDPGLCFEQLIDLCGVDYLNFGDDGTCARSKDGARFAVVMHLLSVRHNRRLRVRTFCPDDALPLVASVTDVWCSANWFEREAFDLYGIVFEGHTDLRRILTDYGFIGHPFRKDFPISGHVEMRYDPEQKRVVYQPVTIEPREITPRVIREPGYGGGR
jgi:NADH-quinone oxidoreductase subunit C